MPKDLESEPFTDKSKSWGMTLSPPVVDDVQAWSAVAGIILAMHGDALDLGPAGVAVSIGFVAAPGGPLVDHSVRRIVG